ncbi:MAG: GHMP kinase [Arenibacter sp.]|nr:GHMP kinase [Arenibacter sp.]
MNASYHSHGKLLLTGEYVVLDGALSLGLPVKYGQGLTVATTTTPGIRWRSLDHEQQVWFETTISTSEITNSSQNTAVNPTTRETLINILREAQKLQPGFLQDNAGYEVTTQLEFPREWGLGSSSTLLNNIAQWAGINPYKLLWKAFGGSGYDIACAQGHGPLLYELKNTLPKVQPVAFDPPFKGQLHFVYLNKKQNSREGIANYRSKSFDQAPLVAAISKITAAIILCAELQEFEALLLKHEQLLAKTLELPRIQEQLFPDFTGCIKSLGAWGGDFVLATGGDATKSYFEKKGFPTVLSYTDMVL